MAPESTLHASCVVIGEAGVLIRGPSGAGKSTLARLLVANEAARGGFARLVGDDRVAIENRHGRLIARGAPMLAGRIEVRGLGILPMAHEAAAVVRLIVDGLAGPPERLPPEGEDMVEISGVALPRLAGRLESLVQIVSWRLRPSYDAGMTT